MDKNKKKSATHRRVIRKCWGQ